MESLHRFFDYALSRGGPKHQSSTTPAVSAAGGNARGVIQYAILNLAALHFRFGHLNLAAAAIDEAVRVAQAGRDHACVTFALSWLHHISDARHADGEEVLQRCVSRARELGLAHLAASTTLALVQHRTTSENASILLSGNPPFASSYNPPSAQVQSVWELLHSLLSTRGKSLEMSPGAAHHQGAQPLASGDAPDPMVARRHLVAGGVWELLGHRTLSSLASRVVLDCYGEDATSLDRSMAAIKVASSCLHGSCIDGDQDEQDAEAGDAEDCVYSIALRRLCDLARPCPYEVANVWSHSGAVLLHEWAVKRGELARARALGVLLRGISPVVSELGPEAYVESLHQWVLMLCLKQQWNSASRAVLALLDFCGVKVRGRIPSFWSPLSLRARAPIFVRACGSTRRACCCCSGAFACGRARRIL